MVVLLTGSPGDGGYSALSLDLPDAASCRATGTLLSRGELVDKRLIQGEEFTHCGIELERISKKLERITVGLSMLRPSFKQANTHARTNLVSLLFSLFALFLLFSKQILQPNHLHLGIGK